MQTAQDTIESIVKEAYDLVGKNSQSEKSNGKTNNKGLNNQALNGQNIYLNNANYGANSSVSKSKNGYQNILQQKITLHKM